jgi:tetratricopeptide (TPR) repeat protein
LGQSTIVGRTSEIARLSEAIEGAAEGRGSVWFLSGEPGIGKSRLAEEVGRLARERGMRSFWGRCWEAGGAPAYWPWVQVLRAVLRTAEPGQVDPYLGTLSQILPELPGDGTASASEGLGPEQARFRLMDAVSNVLADAAQRLPIVIVLEDLHVADVSTALLLDFLSATVRHQPLLIVGTFRELELGSAPAGPQLLRTAQHAERLALQRLDEGEVAEFLVASGEAPDPAFVRALHDTTEGHPLFVVEVAQLWRSKGLADSGGRAIPQSVRTVIRERLATVSAPCMEMLRRGAIVGREFDIGLLESCYGESAATDADSAQEATEGAILVEVAPQRYRFAHFLIRELVYDGISEEERGAAHGRLAEILRTRTRGREPRWPEIAHHLVAAGRCEEAVGAHRNAGQQALRQLAFEDAVQAHANALHAAEQLPDFDAHERIALLVELGHAQTRAGRIDDGKSSCARAAALARALGDAEMLAKAALEHGAHLRFGRVDAELVSLLEEALSALGPSDSPLRARVMARLAAAQQPALEPDEPMALAREAIAMARRLGDRPTLLDTLRNGGSAMVDLGDLEERVALDREHASLGEELGNPVEALRGNMRSLMDYLELARLDDAFRTIHACERITEELDHPAYAWRPMALNAMRALWEGRLDDADRLIEDAGNLGTQGGDPNAIVVYTMQKTRLHQYRGDFEAQLPLLANITAQWGDSEFGRASARVIVAAEHAAVGRTSEALRGYDSDTLLRMLRMGDHTLELGLSRLSVAAQDEAVAKRLHTQLRLRREHLVTGGMLYMTLEGPTSWALAGLARFLARPEEAMEHYAHALRVTRHTGGRPVEAYIALEYARHLLEAADAGGDAMTLAKGAETIAMELGMGAVLEDAQALIAELGPKSPTPAPASEAPPSLSMEHAGDTWLLSYGNVEFHLKDVRGVRILAALVQQPGREFHVLDLSQERNTETEVIDRGDAGELIDEEARRQYRARVLALREELEEAERWNDSGRAERAREELSMIEQELAAAVGLGGRKRRAGAAAERARINVQRRIRDAIRRIESYHPGLAKHLERSVRTGAFCVYEP